MKKYGILVLLAISLAVTSFASPTGKGKGHKKSTTPSEMTGGGRHKKAPGVIDVVTGGRHKKGPAIA